jgi:osmotically-inducible protein OsmY
MTKNFKIMLALSTILLNGCAGGIIASGTAASSIIYDERSIQVMLEDKNIEHLAATAIQQNKTLNKTHISTSSLNHKVLLYGEVQTPQQRTIAYRLISNIPKVKHVFNQIKVNESPSIFDTSQDSWITSKVKMSLFKAKKLHSAQVKVITENKVVYLMGILTKKQQSIATNYARKTAGVRKVITIFETVN